ncbi:MAG: translation initiation factor IF-2 [bacterium]|nr:translation initiation factor IF-2 [bacterium]MDA1024477.1 translation initiation factor IF-2 [bacterium]
MNISELARRMRVSPDELRSKLPLLGFDIGEKALKIPDRDVGRVQYAWRQYKHRQDLQRKKVEQQARLDRKKRVQDGTAEKISIPQTLTVREFAERLNMSLSDVMKELMRAGVLASLNERIDFETATIIAEDLGYITEIEGAESLKDEDGVDRLEEALSEEGAIREARPPVIVVMGHVDHGKTLLLDTIRSANVVSGEHGGITQHIGAYQAVRNDRLLTFIDTPGHEAFTVMRSRGAKVADIAILVVAADDGIQPQTREAIDIIKAAGLPFVVAINKIDKEGANAEMVKGQLGEHGLVPEDWGGKTICVPVSAKTGQHVDQLLDMLILVADMEKETIVADPHRRAIGTIIESHVDKGQGPVATVLVQTGTLKRGDVLGVRAVNFGKVRAMKTWDGQDANEAAPSTPVRILGFKEAPSVGDVLEVPEDVKNLEKLKSQPTRKAGVNDVSVTKQVKSQDEDTEKERITLNLIIKSDVLGSLEAILGMVEKIDNPYVGAKVVQKGLGNVNDAEVLNAEATGAMLIAFNVKATSAAESLARDKNISIHSYNVIYKLFEDVVDKLRLLIPAEHVYIELGTAEVLAVFKKTVKGMVIGGQVKKGVIQLGATARVTRAGEILAEGKVIGLQAGKVDVKEVQQGTQFGMELAGKAKIEVGDVLEFYTEEVKERTLEVHGAKNL